MIGVVYLIVGTKYALTMYLDRTWENRFSDEQGLQLMGENNELRQAIKASGLDPADLLDHADSWTNEPPLKFSFYNKNYIIYFFKARSDRDVSIIGISDQKGDTSKEKQILESIVRAFNGFFPDFDTSKDYQPNMYDEFQSEIKKIILGTSNAMKIYIYVQTEPDLLNPPGKLNAPVKVKYYCTLRNDYDAPIELRQLEIMPRPARGINFRLRSTEMGRGTRSVVMTNILLDSGEYRTIKFDLDFTVPGEYSQTITLTYIYNGATLSPQLYHIDSIIVT